MKEKVEKALDKIRAMLMADGGDIKLLSIEDGVVKVALTGACAGCPGAQMTLTMIVEQTLKEEVPDIKRVEAV